MTKDCHLVFAATEPRKDDGGSPPRRLETEEFGHFQLIGILLFLSNSHPTPPFGLIGFRGHLVIASETKLDLDG